MQPWPTAYTFWHRAGQKPLRLILLRATWRPAGPGEDTTPGMVLGEEGDLSRLGVMAGEGTVVGGDGVAAGRQAADDGGGVPARPTAAAGGSFGAGSVAVRMGAAAAGWYHSPTRSAGRFGFVEEGSAMWRVVVRVSYFHDLQSRLRNHVAGLFAAMGLQNTKTGTWESVAVPARPGLHSVGRGPSGACGSPTARPRGKHASGPEPFVGIHRPRVRRRT